MAGAIIDITPACYHSKIRSDLLRHDVGFAIVPRQETVRFLVVNKFLRAGVEAKLTSQTARDVAEMTERRREMAFLNICGQVFDVARADSFDEVLKVIFVARAQQIIRVG